MANDALETLYGVEVATAREQGRFLRELRHDWNAIAAAKRAWPHLDDTGAGELATWMLVAPAVADVVAVESAIELQPRITSDQIELMIRELAEFDPLELLDGDGNVLPLEMTTRRARRALAGFEVIRKGQVGQVTKIKLVDKLKALEMLGRIHKMFVDRVETTETKPTDLRVTFEIPEGK